MPRIMPSEIKIEKLNNPFEQIGDGYHCFGCSSKNPKGLKLDFFRNGRTLITRWHPDPDLQGYHNLLHGGIQATLLDETAAWWIYAIAGTAGFTSRLSVRYHKGASVAEGDLYTVGREILQRRNLYLIEVNLYNHRLELCSSGELEFFTYPVEKALADLYYPGHEQFKGTWGYPEDFGLPAGLPEALA
ncbi:MAG TPA: PaaI family thioesterase [Bacteroidales bacterium]|nr:PaaI family thioesterase [Bacteroidales bacterium]